MSSNMGSIITVHIDAPHVRVNVVTDGRLVNIRACEVRGEPVTIVHLSEERVHSAVFAILSCNVLCSIATVTPDNRAHINTAYFCFSDELDLYFLSHPRSSHSQNLLANSSAAVTVFSTSQIWTNPGKGLQLFGICSQTRGKHTGKAEELYGRRFPSYETWKVGLAASDVSQRYRFYRLRTSWLKLHDEEIFGDGVFIQADVQRRGLHRNPN
jgi:uncharacterized protein YhbP (UPF0306 family)